MSMPNGKSSVKSMKQRATPTFRRSLTLIRSLPQLVKEPPEPTPLKNELSEFERTWQAWEDIKKRMDAFVKQYAYPHGA